MGGNLSPWTVASRFHNSRLPFLVHLHPLNYWLLNLLSSTGTASASSLWFSPPSAGISKRIVGNLWLATNNFPGFTNSRAFLFNVSVLMIQINRRNGIFNAQTLMRLCMFASTSCVQPSTFYRHNERCREEAAAVIFNCHPTLRAYWLCSLLQQYIILQNNNTGRNTIREAPSKTSASGLDHGIIKHARNLYDLRRRQACSPRFTSLPL